MRLAQAHRPLWLDLENPTAGEWRDVAGALALPAPVLRALQAPTLRGPSSRLFAEHVLLELTAYNRKGMVTPDDFVKLTLLIGPDFILTQHPVSVQALKVVRTELAERSDAPRSQRLALAVLDAVADGMIEASENLEQRAVELESGFLTPTDREMPKRLMHLRRTGIRLRHLVTFQHDAMQRITQTETPIFNPSERLHLADVAHRFAHAESLSESIILINESALNAYLAALNNRMNEVMKVLTVVGAVFLPLVFLTGLYGTNFRSLPGSEGRYAFWIFLGICIAVLLVGALFFYRLGWFRPDEDSPTLRRRHNK